MRPLSDVSFIDDDHYLPRNLHYYLDRRALAAGGSPRGVASLSASANIPGGWELPRFMRETRIWKRFSCCYLSPTHPVKMGTVFRWMFYLRIFSKRTTTHHLRTIFSMSFVFIRVFCMLLYPGAPANTLSCVCNPQRKIVEQLLTLLVRGQRACIVYFVCESHTATHFMLVFVVCFWWWSSVVRALDVEQPSYRTDCQDCRSHRMPIAFEGAFSGRLSCKNFSSLLFYIPCSLHQHLLQVIRISYFGTLYLFSEASIYIPPHHLSSAYSWLLHSYQTLVNWYFVYQSSLCQSWNRTSLAGFFFIPCIMNLLSVAPPLFPHVYSVRSNSKHCFLLVENGISLLGALKLQCSYKIRRGKLRPKFEWPEFHHSVKSVFLFRTLSVFDIWATIHV